MSVCQIKLCRLATDFGSRVVIFQDGGPVVDLDCFSGSASLNSADPFGFGMRPLAGFLLCWDRRPAAAERGGACQPPLLASQTFLSVGCGEKMQNKESICAAGPVDVHASSGKAAGCPAEGFDWLCSSTQGSWKRHHLHFRSQSCVRKRKNGGSRHCGGCSVCTP